MGNWGSGRYRTRNRGPVERSLRFDIRDLKRRGAVKAGSCSSGTYRWSLGSEPAGSISYRIDLSDPDNGFAVLSFSVDGEPKTQRIAIIAKPCRYGGRRFYFYCGLSWQLCEVLCGVGGVFAARDYHRLTYYSQSEDRLGRLRRAADKAEARFLAKDGRPWPRGGNAARLRERWIALDQETDAELVRVFGRRFARYGLAQ